MTGRVGQRGVGLCGVGAVAADGRPREFRSEPHARPQAGLIDVRMGFREAFRLVNALGGPAITRSLSGSPANAPRPGRPSSPRSSPGRHRLEPAELRRSLWHPWRGGRMRLDIRPATDFCPAEPRSAIMREIIRVFYELQSTRVSTHGVCGWLLRRLCPGARAAGLAGVLGAPPLADPAIVPALDHAADQREGGYRPPGRTPLFALP